MRFLGAGRMQGLLQSNGLLARSSLEKPHLALAADARRMNASRLTDPLTRGLIEHRGGL